MEAATEKFSRNFSWMLGDWCRAHGVKYIGHVIEDDNAHQRLGHGCGHYFRALDGQDMGGIDIVLHQYIPGMADMEHMAWLEEKRANPAFFRYTLPKLASSHTHIQPIKKGRAVCEIYGGFGWAEGIPEMKQMTDLMLIGGINYFVPHAFNAKYPDMDHPPHFYARGTNYQYPVFGQLMAYTQRMSHMLSGGLHRADVAVYYNAEVEWSGGKCQLQQEVCKLFGRNQVEFDIVPQDTVCDEMTVEDGTAWVNDVSYGALVVPYSQYLPVKVLKAFTGLAEKGLPVWFVDALPDAASDGSLVGELLQKCKSVPFGELIDALTHSGLKGVQTESECPSLRYYQIRRDRYDVVMLWNESIFQEVDSRVKLPAEGDAVFYDAWNNKVFACDQKESGVRVRLAPTQSIVLVYGSWNQEFPSYDYRDTEKNPLKLQWQVSLKTADQKEFTPYFTLSELRNLAHDLPEFGGIIRYEAELKINDTQRFHALEFEKVGEIAELWVNETSCGFVVEKPYRFYIGECLKPGKNRIRVEVMTNIAYKEKDRLSSYVSLPVSGLAGEVRLA